MASGWQQHTWEPKQGRNLKKSHPGAIRPHDKPGDRKSAPFALPTACVTSSFRSYKRLVKNLIMADDVFSIFSLPWHFTFLCVCLFCTPGMVFSQRAVKGSFMSSTSSVCKPLICREIANCNVFPEVAARAHGCRWAVVCGSLCRACGSELWRASAFLWQENCSWCRARVRALLELIARGLPEWENLHYLLGECNT